MNISNCYLQDQLQCKDQDPGCTLQSNMRKRQLKKKPINTDYGPIMNTSHAEPSPSTRRMKRNNKDEICDDETSENTTRHTCKHQHEKQILKKD